MNNGYSTRTVLCCVCCVCLRRVSGKLIRVDFLLFNCGRAAGPRLRDTDETIATHFSSSALLPQMRRHTNGTTPGDIICWGAKT